MNNTDERSTPPELFEPLNNEFHFELDVCAFSWNTKCTRWFDIIQNGLKQDWAPSRCWNNMPYSEIKFWLRKARIEANKGALVCNILPCDTSTHWFHDYIWDKSMHQFRKGVEVRFPDKRYKFGDNINSAKFATIIAIFTNETK